MKQGYQPTEKITTTPPPAVKPAHKPFQQETVQLITSLIYQLGDLQERVRKLEEERQIRTLSEDDNWLNKLIDEVNASALGEETP